MASRGKNEWWGAGVVVCLEQVADLHIAQLMPLPLTISQRRRQVKICGVASASQV